MLPYSAVSSRFRQLIVLASFKPVLFDKIELLSAPFLQEAVVKHIGGTSQTAHFGQYESRIPSSNSDRFSLQNFSSVRFCLQYPPTVYLLSPASGRIVFCALRLCKKLIYLFVLNLQYPSPTVTYSTLPPRLISSEMRSSSRSASILPTSSWDIDF